VDSVRRVCTILFKNCNDLAQRIRPRSCRSRTHTHTSAGCLIVLTSCARDSFAGRMVAPSLWILLERLRDNILAGKCEMLDDCFVESS
jgi:hypothetical protein